MSLQSSGDFGVDFLLINNGDGTWAIDPTQIISDSRVVMQAVLSKLLGTMWWFPGPQVHLLSFHGELWTPELEDQTRHRIVELVESEQQTDNVIATFTVENDGSGTIQLFLSFTVSNDQFAFDIVVNGKSLDVFVASLTN